MRNTHKIFSEFFSNEKYENKEKNELRNQMRENLDENYMVKNGQSVKNPLYALFTNLDLDFD